MSLPRSTACSLEERSVEHPAATSAAVCFDDAGAAVKEKVAAIAFVERYDGKILAVWNKRFGSWTFPGGKVESTDSTYEDAVVRELREETGCGASSVEFLYAADDTNGYRVFVYRVEIYPVFFTPKETEEGCPVTWFTREEFLRWGLYPEFYRKVFLVAP
jgi:8-oxo-dGTP pyrophosphatase MutT (NUDIX family)